MCVGGGSAPSPPPMLPQAPTAAPSPQGGAGSSFRKALQKKRGASFGGTLLTGPGGLTESANTQQKTLLGG
jgi:hypothetical protein